MCQSSCLIMLTPIFASWKYTEALQRLAAKHREQFQVPVVGITGSNGKTVVKEWIYQLLSPEKVITRSPRSYNSQIGVPLSVWMMNEHTELVYLRLEFQKWVKWKHYSLSFSLLSEC